MSDMKWWNTLQNFTFIFCSCSASPEAKCDQITYAMPVGSSHFVIDLPDNHVNTSSMRWIIYKEFYNIKFNPYTFYNLKKT